MYSILVNLDVSKFDKSTETKYFIFSSISLEKKLFKLRIVLSKCISIPKLLTIINESSFLYF